MVEEDGNIMDSRRPLSNMSRADTKGEQVKGRTARPEWRGTTGRTRDGLVWWSQWTNGQGSPSRKFLVASAKAPKQGSAVLFYYNAPK